jgi:3D (Asp-Asp-Asp) domain-containing protein
MKCLITFLGVSFLLNHVAAASYEQSVLARVTVYWRNEGSGGWVSSNGCRLREGHCAVDPKKIPFGSRVLFDDISCIAVDTGRDVINRKAARLTGRNPRERNALVIDRFFETRKSAMAWAESHPPFMNVRIVTPSSALPQRPHWPFLWGHQKRIIAALKSVPALKNQPTVTSERTPASWYNDLRKG